MSLLRPVARAAARAPSRLASSSASPAAAVSFRRCASGSAASGATLGKHPAVVSTRRVVGSQVSQSLDLSQIAIGHTISVPYESTMSDAERALWAAAFQVHDRLYTSDPFAQSLQLPERVLPMYQVLFSAISMGHVDESRGVLDIGFSDAVYVRPAYVGDTLRQQFTIKHLKNTSGGDAALLTVGCELFNQRNQLVMTCDKTMLYPGVSVPAHRLSPPPSRAPAQPRSHLLSHILYHSDSLPTNNNLANIQEGQLLLHKVARPIGKSSNMSLATMFRWTHPSIYNEQRFKDQELLVPGGLVLAAAISASSRGLFETLNERLDSCVFLNKVSPVDLLGAITYIHSIRTVKDGVEEVKVTTLGLKNVDVVRELAGVELPAELFTHPHLHRKQFEALAEQYAPQLRGKIVVRADRTITRQSPYAQNQSIPLL